MLNMSDGVHRQLDEKTVEVFPRDTILVPENGPTLVGVHVHKLRVLGHRHFDHAFRMGIGMDVDARRHYAIKKDRALWLSGGFWL